MTRKPAILLAALLVSGIAGCDRGDPPPSASSSTSASPQQGLAVAQEWVRCLRDNGFARMPDPRLHPQGYVEYPEINGFAWKEELVRQPAILQACKPIQDRIPASARRPREQVSAEDLRKLTAFAACMRSNGFPAFPDPNAAGEFDLRGTGLTGGLPPGPRREQAEKTCHPIWGGAVKVVDDGGGRK